MQVRNPKIRQLIVAGAIIFICVMLCMEFSSRDTLATDGVYTIAEVTHVARHTGRSGTLSGYRAAFTYRLGGKSYGGENRGYGFDASMTGRRYFVLVAPGKTRKTVLLHDHPVPEWFTAEAPPQGWSRLPSSAELRNIMSNGLQKRR
ncbi:MAG: hypothetical protein LIO85_10955 [Rikenellaceae bacterium]|nr:hypothetical protein [Rikenellaceae bacterium]